MAQGRSLLKQIFINFKESIKPRKVWGEVVGRDHLGTTYYERPQKTTGTPRKSARWFVPKDGTNFQQEIHPKWNAWLRHQRKDPPTEEEIASSILAAKETLRKAEELETQRRGTPVEQKIFEKPTFPAYEEYEETPGDRNKTAKP